MADIDKLRVLALESVKRKIRLAEVRALQQRAPSLTGGLGTLGLTQKSEQAVEAEAASIVGQMTDDQVAEEATSFAGSFGNADQIQAVIEPLVGKDLATRMLVDKRAAEQYEATSKRYGELGVNPPAPPAPAPAGTPQATAAQVIRPPIDWEAERAKVMADPTYAIYEAGKLRRQFSSDPKFGLTSPNDITLEADAQTYDQLYKYAIASDKSLTPGQAAQIAAINAASLQAQNDASLNRILNQAISDQRSREAALKLDWEKEWARDPQNPANRSATAAEQGNAWAREWARDPTNPANRQANIAEQGMQWSQEWARDPGNPANIQAETARQQLAFDKEKEKQRILEDASRMGISAAQILGTAANAGLQALTELAPHAINPFQQYIIGYEPGGVAQQIGQRYGFNVNPVPAQGTPVNTNAPLEQVQPLIVQALARMGIGAGNG